MTASLLLVIAAVFAVDVGLRPWRPLGKHAPANAIYLLLAYGPMLAVPHVGPWALTALVGGVSLFSLFNFSRMVGLTGEPRFFVASFLGAAACFVVARAHWYGLFQAMPALAIFGVLGAGAARLDPRAFLQRLCLAWLGLLVYGYLAAHASLYPDLHTAPIAFSGGLWLALVILMAKFGDVAWVLTQRLAPGRVWLQLVVSPLGGALGGAVIAGVLAVDGLHLAILGLGVGTALGLASRAHQLIVLDVVGDAPARPLKGTMLFGFAFAMALAYHYIRYFWT